MDINLGFCYKGIMCYNDGTAYVLCESDLWPKNRIQVSLPKQLKSISKFVGKDKNGDEYVYYFNHRMNDYKTHNIIDMYHRDKLSEVIEKSKPRQINYPVWYTPKKDITEVEQLAKDELKNSPLDEKKDNAIRRKTFSNYHGILKYLRNNAKVYREIGNKTLTMSLGSIYVPDNSIEYSLPDVMTDVTTLVCRISNREFSYKLTYNERTMKTQDFLYNQLPLVFNTFEIAGDKISIKSLDERDFLSDNIELYANKLGVSLPDNEPIMFKWSTIGDKIVSKRVRATYPGRVPKLEFGKIISNKNMADTLIKLNVITESDRQQEDDHVWGTIFEAIIYIANKQKNEFLVNKMIKKLINTLRGW